MKKCTAFALIVGLLQPAATLWATEVCELLNVGKVTIPATPGDATPPSIDSMPIQVYTTVTAGSPPGLPDDHKCDIAEDLIEIDIMMEDVGFNGYTGTNSPLLGSASLLHVDNRSDRNFLRALARAVMNGDAEAEDWLGQLKANTDLYQERALNVYFVAWDAEFQSFDEDAYPFEVKGMHIRDADGETEKIIFYGYEATPTTLSHEFGHAFSNGHVNFVDLDGEEWCAKYLPHNDVSEEPSPPSPPYPQVDMECEFDQLNYMWAGSTADRQALGDPQKVRMRLNKKSIIYQFQKPLAGDELDCPDHSSDPTKNCERLWQIP